MEHIKEMDIQIIEGKSSNRIYEIQGRVQLAELCKHITEILSTTIHR
jgi:hypothetical protein